jgi:hypothetical protein
MHTRRVRADKAAWLVTKKKEEGRLVFTWGDPPIQRARDDDGETPL